MIRKWKRFVEAMRVKHRLGDIWPTLYVNVWNPETEKLVLFIELFFRYTPICLGWWLASKLDGT